MRRTLALAALLGLVLTGCTTTIDGAGAMDSSVSTDGPTDEPTDGPTDEPTDEPTEVEPLSCEGDEVVEPSGGPYCYLVPSGLSVLDEIELPGGGEFTSAVGIGGRDVIAVTMFPTEINTEDLSDTDLQEASDLVVEQELSSAFDFASTEGERLEVDNSRTLKYSGTSKPTSAEPEPFTIDFYFVYRGKAKLQVNCQYQNNEAEMLTGCEELLDSLQFRPEE